MRLHFLHPKSWYIELLATSGLLGIMMSITGAYWDIGWHFDYGRDTFWSPPHLLIYGSTMLAAVFFTLNFAIALIHNLRHKDHALFILILFGLASVGLIFLSAPIDELWHRLFGIDVQIMSLPHLMLLFGGIAGGMMIMAILRYHALHARHRFLLETILIPCFFGGALAGMILVFGESEFTTLPLWHPVQSRPLWVYPVFSLLLFYYVPHFGLTLLTKRSSDTFLNLPCFPACW